MVMAEMAKPRDTFVLARGDYRNQARRSRPAYPPSCRRCPRTRLPNRLTLAEWLVNPAASAHRARRRESLSGRCISASAS